MSEATIIDLPLVARFQRQRWGETRKAIHALSVGEKVTVATSERNNAVTTIARLADAYGGLRQYRSRTVPAGIEVERIA